MRSPRRGLERKTFLVGLTIAREMERPVCAGGASTGAISMTSLGMPCCAPCSRHLKSQPCSKTCSRDSSRSESVTQVSLSPLEYESRTAKFRAIRIPRASSSYRGTTGRWEERRRRALKCNGAKGQDGRRSRRDHIALPRGVEDYCGQAAPPSIQIFIRAMVSARESGGRARPVPGSQPQPTRSSEETCSSNCASERPPVCLGSLSWRHSSAGVRPTNTILCSGGGSDHFGFPGGMFAPGRFADWWQVL